VQARRASGQAQANPAAAERRQAPGRGILLGVTGGIAAYKTAELARLLVSDGYHVFPIMTEWATRFLGPLTLEALTGEPVRIATPGPAAGGSIEHISLARAAELLLIAPLTANTLAKLANGMADNFLTATYLAHTGPTLACPAMNQAMLAHPATRRNLERLAGDGVVLCYGAPGELACGETGAGRMAEPQEIRDRVASLLSPKIPALANVPVLISAGPTIEDLDPVRFLTNRSSGKMGFALARAFRNAGARVTLVHGPCHLDPPGEVAVVPVRSAAEMAAAVSAAAAAARIIVMVAAVADYRPARSPHKLKKAQFNGTLHLERTTDILAALGKNKQPGQILAGFAAESENLLENARDKLRRKHLDFIFANEIGGSETGFATDDNQLIAIDADGGARELGRDAKANLATEIVGILAAALAAPRT